MLVTIYEHTNSRRISGGNYSVSIDVGVQLESYPDALMTINFSSREDGACGEKSMRSQPRGFTLTKGVNGLTLCMAMSTALPSNGCHHKCTTYQDSTSMLVSESLEL